MLTEDETRPEPRTRLHLDIVDLGSDTDDDTDEPSDTPPITPELTTNNHDLYDGRRDSAHTLQRKRAPRSRESSSPLEIITQEQFDEECARRVQHEEDLRIQQELEASAALARALQDEEEAIYRPRLRACAVCSDEKQPLEFPAKPPSAVCEHTVNTCKDCLQQWISSELESKGWDRLNCPECSVQLQHDDVFRGASEEDFQRYDTLAARSALAADPDFVWCVGPGCCSGQIHVPDRQNPVFYCASCHFKMCIKHQAKWHDDETCEQYDYRVSGQRDKDEEKASAELLEKATKKCPGKNCGWRIEKSEGCDHMRCKCPVHADIWRRLT